MEQFDESVSNPLNGAPPVPPESGEAAFLIERLTALHTAGNELAKTTSVCEMWRRSVELARDALGFDRFSIWLKGSNEGQMRGTFGIDERGDIRDEQERELNFAPDDLLELFEHLRTSSLGLQDTALFNEAGDVVGQGEKLIAGLADHEDIVGVIFVDNLCSQSPITEGQRWILSLYASTLSHLYSTKRAEEALSESEELYSLVTETSQTGIQIAQDGRFVYINRRGNQILGYEPKELIGQPLTSIMSAEGRAQYADILAHRADDDQWTDQFELQVLRKDGQTRWLELRSCPIQFRGRSAVLSNAIDITDRKEAERVTAATEELFSNYFQHGLIGMAVTSPTKGWLRVNHHLCEMLGYSEDELREMTWAELTHPDDLAADVALFERMMAGDIEAYSIDKRFIRKDSTIVYVHLHVGCVRKDDGGMDYVIAHLQDITERKAAEQAIRESEERFRNLILASPMGIYLYELNENGELVFKMSNPAADRITGIPGSELMGLTITEAFPALKNTNIPQRYREAAEQGTSFHTTDFSYRDGRVTGAFDIYAFQTSPGKMAVLFLDVAERAEAEQTRRRLTTVIEQAADEIAVADISGAVEYVNPAFESASGFTRSEVEGQALWSLFRAANGGAIEAEIQAALRIGDAWVGRLQGKRKDGDGHAAQAAFTVIKDEEDRVSGYAAVWRDITSQVRLENQLRQAQKMEAVGQLAGGVAHDFNNMLQAIMGYTSLGLSTLPAHAPQRDYFEQAIKGGHKAAELVKRLLTFSRRGALHLRKLDLNEVITDIVKMLRRLIGEHVDLDVHLGSGHCVVRADQGQVEQMVMNLCLNARDAMPSGGSISIETASVKLDRSFCLRHAWAREGAFVVLSVSDTGTGIAPEVKERIFEPFFSTKEVGRGTGLGLATVYAIAEQHDGFINLYSEEGHGSTFQIFLPVLEGDVVPDEMEAEMDGQRRLPLGHGELILIAEDEELVRELAEQVLIGAGYRVLLAADGEEAEMLFEEHADSIALCLLDVVMPKKSGADVFNTVKAHRPDIPVVFSSGYTYQVLARGQFDVAGARLIQKPYDTATLLKNVHEALEESRPY